MSNHSLLKSTFQVTFFSFLGIILGFFNQLVVAFYFGATPQRDAYFVALVIPTYVATLFAGSVGAIFMSSYIEHQTHKTTEEISLFTSRVINVCGLLLFALVVFGIVFAQEIVSFLTPGFNDDQLRFTSELLRILLPTIIFLVLSNLLTTIYQAHNRFLLPSVAPVIGIVITISAVLLWSRDIGIKSLAYGSLAASIFNFTVLSPIIFKNRFYRLSFVFEKEIMNIFKIAAPLFIAGIFYRSTSIFERMIASTLERGSISYLGYANQLMNTLSSIAAGGIATTIFPLMSKGWELNELDVVRKYFGKGVRIVLLVTFPILVIFIVLGDSIVRLLFERGAFDAHATTAVSNSLSIMMVAFICLSVGSIVSKGFYCSNKTRIFSAIVSSEVIIYLCFGYFLSKTFSYLGLAIALSISSFYTMVISILVLRKIFHGFNASLFFRDLIRIIITSFFAGVVIYISNRFLIGTMKELLSIIISSGIGLLCYSLMIVFILPVEDAVNIKYRVANFINFKMGKQHL